MALLMASFGAGAAAAVIEVRVIDISGQAIPDVAVILHEVSAENAANSTIENGRIEIDQVDEQFSPAMSIVPRGRSVWFPNSDNVRHHVYSFSEARPFELTLYHADDAPPVQFDRTGVVLLGCNIHDSMRAAMVITDQAVYGVTDEAGRVQLRYETTGTTAVPLRASLWHEQMGADSAREFLVEPSRSESEAIVLTLPINWKPIVRESVSDLKSRLQGFRKGSPQQ